MSASSGPPIGTEARTLARPAVPPPLVGRTEARPAGLTGRTEARPVIDPDGSSNDAGPGTDAEPEADARPTEARPLVLRPEEPEDAPGESEGPGTWARPVGGSFGSP